MNRFQIPLFIFCFILLTLKRDTLVAQTVKNIPAIQKTWV